MNDETLLHMQQSFVILLKARYLGNRVFRDGSVDILAAQPPQLLEQSKVFRPFNQVQQIAFRVLEK
jgi:hypothetical protein